MGRGRGRGGACVRPLELVVAKIAHQPPLLQQRVHVSDGDVMGRGAGYLSIRSLEIEYGMKKSILVSVEVENGKN